MATVAMGLGQFQKFLSRDIGTGLHTCYLGMKSETEVSNSFLTLCYHMECSPPGFSVHGILHTRILEWVVISFSRKSSQPRDGTWVSHIAGRCFTLGATREALGIGLHNDFLLKIEYDVDSMEKKIYKNTPWKKHGMFQKFFKT